MGKVYDINVHRKDDKPLKDLADPCAGCLDVHECCHTCERAANWWAMFAKKFTRQKVIYQLGG